MERRDQQHHFIYVTLEAVCRIDCKKPKSGSEKGSEESIIAMNKRLKILSLDKNRCYYQEAVKFSYILEMTD